MQKKILYILLISFFCCNFVLAGEALAVSSAVKNLGETALTGFGGAETVNISEEISDTDLNELTEKGLQNSGVIMNLSSGIGSLLGAALSFLGVIFLLLMIYGGFLWMLARGNEQAIEKAKNLIQAAIIGLMIVLSAYAITSLVGSSFSNI